MTLVASILMLALTRAEIIERFKNPPVTRADGLVQVFADCPSDMRREYQGPVSSFVAEVCTTLSTALKERPGHFTQPAIIVYVGDIRTNNSQVVSREQVRPDGSVCTRIRLLAPGFTDTDQLRRETVKAFDAKLLYLGCRFAAHCQCAVGRCAAGGGHFHGGAGAGNMSLRVPV